MTDNQRIMYGAIMQARDAAYLGYGETDGNNRGSYIYGLRRRDGTGGFVTGRGSWCGSMCSADLNGSAKTLGLPRLCVPSRGARRLARNVAGAEGAEVYYRNGIGTGVVPSEHSIGGIISWKRLGWRGHVGFWYRYDYATDTLWTVEGNVGKFPSLVTHFGYPNGTWRKRLDMLVGF